MSRTLRDLVAEGEATGPMYRHHLQSVIRGSYRSHYRRILPLVLGALTFRSDNQDHRPVLDALALVRRHLDSKHQCYSLEESVPLDGVVPIAWRDAVSSATPGIGAGLTARACERFWPTRA